MEDTAMVVGLVRDDDTGWRLESADEDLVAAPNAYLRYLADRCYSPRTIRTYGYGLVVRFPPDRGGLAATRRPGRASRWSARN